MSTFNGKKVSIEIFGESHAPEIGVKVKGFPEFAFSKEKLCEFMNRRKANGKIYSTARSESDEPDFSGVENNVIKGDFMAIIKNRNVKSSDYNELYGKPRPSHADLTSYFKDGTLDFSGGGRFSGRMTAPLCVAGGLIKEYLEKKGIRILSYIAKIGKAEGRSYKTGIPSISEIDDAIKSDFPALSEKEAMLKEIENAKKDEDSVGGIIECVVFGMKRGVGDCLFSGLEGKISSLLYAIPAVKGVEFGAGFSLADMRGSEANDQLCFKDGRIVFLSDNAGGINGGISNGEPITMRIAIRPTPSIAKEQSTVDLINKTDVKIKIKGRHDACIVPRALPCVESAVAIAIYDEL